MTSRLLAILAVASTAPTLALAQSNLFPSTGNVGIGTTIPYAKLTVVGNSGNAHASTLTVSSPSGALGSTPGISFYPTFGISSDTTPRRAADILSGFDAGGWGTEFLSFRVGAPMNDGGNLTPERMRLTATGRLGIGISKPRALLDVGDTVYLPNWIETVGHHDLAPSSVLSITGGTLNGGGPAMRGAQDHWLVSSKNSSLTLDFGAPYAVAHVAFSSFWRGDGRFIPRDYRIELSTNGTSWTQAVLVTQNQNIDVAHPINSTARYLRITVLEFQSGQTLAALSGLQVMTKDLGAGASAGKPVWAAVTNSDHVFLNTIGNVGIGTKSPTHKLSVNGSVRAKEVIVETTGWADHVFSPDYALPTLTETEQHIAEQGHLPGIPSAQEVAQNGVSIGELQMKLLQKIEELTLHQIAMDKRMRSLEKENEALRTEISMHTRP